MSPTNLLLMLPFSLGSSDAGTRMGEGLHCYEWTRGWIQPAGGKELGNTHGVIVEDSGGNLYVNTDTERAISVYAKDGTFQRAFGADQGEGVHGMCIVKEKAGEFLYHVNFRLHKWRKLTLQGDVVWDNATPMESGKYQSADQFHPTSIAVVPDGPVFVADGYGTSWVHQFDTDGKYVRSFGGPGEMNCCHGLMIDTRKSPTTLLVADRENHRLLRYDLEGKKLGEITGMLRRPCSIQEHDGYLAVPDLAGRVTILDRDDKLVTHLGDNPEECLRAQNGVARERWKDGVFISPHSAHWDKEGNLYVMDWNYLGRVNKLARVRVSEVKDGVGYTDTPFIPGSEWRVHDKNRPVPEVIVPGAAPGAPPSDALVLFDGKDMSHWKSGDKDGQWKVGNGYMEVNGTGSVETKASFGDCQLHLEFATPAKVDGESQHRGNSGVFLMGRYEVQILDSFQNRSYADGQAAALYGQRPPLVNACRAPGEWQSYDIVFRAPRFDGDTLVSPAVVTVLHNGVVVQASSQILGATAHQQAAKYAAHPAELPIGLQDHGNPMRFRNIWIRRM